MRNREEIQKNNYIKRENREMRNCTFTPKTNSKSRSISHSKQIYERSQEIIDNKKKKIN